jgi:osmoprotectant transport system permease protein
MEEQQTLWAFMAQQSDKLAAQTLTHIGLTFISLLAAVVIALPAGIFIARREKWAAALLGFAGILQTIPSIALLGFMIPLFGIGPLPAIVALFLYALLPILRNTYTGIKAVDATVVEAARAMGMTGRQILGQVQLPLALPVILAGIRTATVINVGVATLAAYIAAGGLGEFIFGGIALNNTNMILAGAIPAAVLALAFDAVLAWGQRRLQARRLPRRAWLLPLLLLLCSFYYVWPRAQGRLLAGFTPEFMGRQDGYLGLRDRYGLDLPTVVISDAVMYKAAYEKKLDVISGYSTDGRLKAYDLVVLQDDKTIFPPYYAAPVVRTQVLARYPELAPVLNLLAGRINDAVMTELNYRVDFLKQAPEKVARDFLVQQRLWKPPRQGRKGLIRIGSKIFAEQYVLIHIYRMLISGYTDLQVETKTGLGGTKICFDALVNRQIDLYPEYTGTGLLVLLHPSPRQLRALMGSKDQVYAYVKEQFARQYQLTWLQPIGFNNAYALMMRRQQARDLGLHSISDLKSYIGRKP